MGTRAVEVKTTAAHTARVVSIHGVDQLLAPAGGKLCLHFVRVEAVPEGQLSIPGLVDELLELGCASERLFAGLADVGISGVDLVGLKAFRFDVRERRTFAITADTPRIVPESFVGGEPPVAVVDLRYQLDLDHLSDFEADSEWPAYLAAMSATPVDRGAV